MERVVALLRGINVGGHRLSMADLRRHLEDLGCTDVATYIQSGNVVLTPPAVERPLDDWLSEQIGALAGYAVPTITRSARELDAVVAHNPYPSASGTTLHVVFFANPPARALLDGLAAFAPEECTSMGRDLYLQLPNGMGRALLPAALEKAVKQQKAAPGTARNWSTVLQLQQMAHP